MGLVIKETLEDTAGFDDNLTIAALMFPELIESFNLFPDFSYDKALNVTLSLDTEKLQPAVHNMIEFNSFIQVGDDILAAGDNGIYKLSGDTDDGEPFITGVVWDKTSFTSLNNKKIRAVFLEGDISETQMQASTETGKGVFPLKRNRIPVPRNLIGKDWSLRLSGFKRLEAMELEFILGRR